MARPSAKALGKRKAPSGPAGNASKKAKSAGGGKPSKPTPKGKGKGKGKDTDGPELGPTGKPKRKPDQPKKVKLRDQKVIPVPRTVFAGDDGDESDDELLADLGEEEGLEVENAGGFLASLEPTALSRTVKETKRIHELDKARNVMPTKNKKKELSPELSDISDYDFDSEVDFSDEELSGDGAGSDSDLGDSDLGSDDDNMGSDDDVDSDGSDDSDQSAFNAEFDLPSSDDDSESEDEAPRKRKKRAEEEAEYEVAGRARWAEKEEEKKDTLEVGRLPIKLPTGEVKLVEGSTVIAVPQEKKKPAPVRAPTPESESEDEGSDTGAEASRIAAQPGRFGRMGVAQIVAQKGWKNAQRLAAAKEQMAEIGAEILAGGELIDVGPILTRLATWALPTVPNPDGEDDKALPVPNSIRATALLSLLAVYKDLIPGYRIRQLTAHEEAEKVRDEVRRMREGEKLLVRNYKGYLKTLETEIKNKTPLASVALKCMCDLLASVPHFNFSENIMGVLVGRVGRRSWDADSEMILDTFVRVFRIDHAATYSQALVRLIARMIKERKFQVHANVLSCLLHLRLRTELNQMHDGKKKRQMRDRKDGKDKQEKKYKSEVRKKWQTKNQKKREKELKEIEKEMAEAEAEVDQEERAVTQTETLKNLFVLYFSILKFPGRSPLLAAALEGISHFTHLINVDFFRDLLQVLRQIIADRKAEAEDAEDLDAIDPVGAGARVRIRMLAIVTAFDLLSGQGEALNIDLADFVTELFALLRPLAVDTSIEDPPDMTAATAAAAAKQKRAGVAKATSERPPAHTLSTSALLFRCLDAIFFPRYFGRQMPAVRCAAFAKRLCECALTFPPGTAREALQFVRRLAAKEPRLANLLDTEERMFDGVYRADMDDPQLTNPFTTSLYELDTLAERHFAVSVRREAKRLREANFL